MIAIAIGTIATACAAHQPGAYRGKSQPAMESALQHLRMAERRLMLASPTKGGHRIKALRAVRIAIRQTIRGIEYDNNR